jgi:hypothetical protein
MPLCNPPPPTFLLCDPHSDVKCRLARQQRLLARSKQIEPHSAGEGPVPHHQKGGVSFISPPQLSQTAGSFNHVASLIESCMTASAATTPSPSLPPHASLQSLDDHPTALSIATSNAKRIHIIQQQQQPAQHPTLHPMFTAALLSRPVHKPPAAAADIVARTSSRDSPKANFQTQNP